MATTGPAPRGALRDPVAYLEGRWLLERDVVDERTGAVGRFLGEAAFVRDRSGALAYSEDGELLLPGYRGRASRAYRYVAAGERVALVEFADGRPFHVAALSTEGFATRHRCGEDDYLGCYLLGSERRWSLDWEVRGPAKSLRIDSSFERLD